MPSNEEMLARIAREGGFVTKAELERYLEGVCDIYNEQIVILSAEIERLKLQQNPQAHSMFPPGFKIGMN